MCDVDTYVGGGGVGFIGHDEAVETAGLEELFVHTVEKAICSVNSSQDHPCR